jgi:hypothetical protein
MELEPYIIITYEDLFWLFPFVTPTMDKHSWLSVVLDLVTCLASVCNIETKKYTFTILYI